MSWLVQQFGSKKLVAAFLALVAGIVAPVLHAHFGMNVDAASLAVTLGATVGPFLLYILAQWHVDIATNGATTTAAASTTNPIACAYRLIPAAPPRGRTAPRA